MVLAIELQCAMFYAKSFFGNYNLSTTFEIIRNHFKSDGLFCHYVISIHLHWAAMDDTGICIKMSCDWRLNLACYSIVLVAQDKTMSIVAISKRIVTLQPFDRCTSDLHNKKSDSNNYFVKSHVSTVEQRLNHDVGYTCL